MANGSVRVAMRSATFWLRISRSRARSKASCANLRACQDMPSRQRILTEFYERGAMWQQHKAETNSWIVDSDNVLFLRPISELAAPAASASVVGMYTHVERERLDGGAASRLDREVCTAIRAAGGRMLVTFATDPAENNYPRHPIRTGEHGLVWFATFAVAPTLPLTSVEQRRLAPIARSRMR